VVVGDLTPGLFAPGLVTPGEVGFVPGLAVVVVVSFFVPGVGEVTVPAFFPSFISPGLSFVGDAGVPPGFVVVPVPGFLSNSWCDGLYISPWFSRSSAGFSLCSLSSGSFCGIWFSNGLCTRLCSRFPNRLLNGWFLWWDCMKLNGITFFVTRLYTGCRFYSRFDSRLGTRSRFDSRFWGTNSWFSSWFGGSCWFCSCWFCRSCCGWFSGR